MALQRSQIFRIGFTLDYNGGLLQTIALSVVLKTSNTDFTTFSLKTDRSNKKKFFYDFVVVDPVTFLK